MSGSLRLTARREVGLILCAVKYILVLILLYLSMRRSTSTRIWRRLGQGGVAVARGAWGGASEGDSQRGIFAVRLQLYTTVLVYIQLTVGLRMNLVSDFVN